jgi:hypothetical protein
MVSTEDPPEALSPGASAQLATDSTAAGGPQRSSPSSVVAWTPERDLEHPEWVRWGHRLGTMGRVSNWLIGDWVNYGATKWGEKYTEAARITGFDTKSLRNIVYVSRRFDSSRRRDNLTWSHHAELAVFDTEQQERWLDRAASDRLSVADLRIELRYSQRGDKGARDDSGEHERTARGSSVVCPRCGETIALDESLV